MDALARIIDANANRAREAFRVLEDLARFALNDEGLSARLKNLRHGLREALASTPLDAAQLLASRDTWSDVGTQISTPAEFQRAGLADLAAANAARAAEALRSLEEAAKAIHVEAAMALERLRYSLYTIEKDLRTALGSGRARQWRLCVLLSEGLCCGRSWEHVAKAAMAGGADCLQLREKSLDDAELLRRAESLVRLAHAASPRVDVVINDRVDIALLSGADGVHLGQGDLPIARAREMAGHRLLIGGSTSNIDEARAAARAGADSIGVGPMFATTTKQKDHIAGPAYLAEVVADPITTRLPHLAIGGISAANARELARFGCRGVAVSSAVCGADDPARVCREIIAALETLSTEHRAPAG